MRLAYLMNTYPMVSSTFIGREIEALEAQGHQVDRYAARRWDGDLVDPADRREAGLTSYLLEDGGATLLKGLVRETLSNPAGVWRALKLWRRLLAAAGERPVTHVAYLLEAVALRRRLRARPVAHLHAHWSTNTAAIALLCRALGGPGYSFTVHGPDELFQCERNSLGLKIEHAAFVACISHFCRSQCMIFSDPADWDRLRIVHCGVQPARYAPQDGAPRAQGPGRLLFVGRLSKIKGADVLLQAFARARQAAPGARLRILGDGDQRPRLEAMAAELGLSVGPEADVDFAGFRSQDEVRAAMAEADMLILPSFAEGLPVVFMEALASGIPVIASRIAAAEELIEDGRSGLMVAAGDVEGLARAIETLLADPARRAAMGAHGRARVEADFDIAREADWLAELIAGAADGALPAGLRPGPRAS